jgi:3-oxo-4-pregnene-20-carboxyl-CoA dehydrogenase beta subunit
VTRTGGGVSDTDRDMLRDSVRGFLADHWPVEGAAERATDPAAIHTIWHSLAAQGLAGLGARDQETGLRETLLVFEELGRAHCPAPLLGAVALNHILAATTPAPAAQAIAQATAAGTAAIAVALGSWDGDPAAGSAQLAGGPVGGHVTGHLAFVEDTAIATHLLVLTGPPPRAVLLAADPAAIRPTPGLAIPALAELELDAAALATLDADADHLAEIIRLCCAARALGAAERGFELALEHAKLRRQFGQVIGSFQALQHKLADCQIRLDGSRLTLDSAADAHDRGDPAWRVFAAAALAYAGPSLRQTILETHHTMGAIGYAEEHELPRHFRRVHADLVRFGGAPHARAHLADWLLEGRN